MDIVLPRALEEFVQNQVDSGHYNSRSEVYGEAIRLLMFRQEYAKKQAALRTDIATAIDEAERGEARACTPEDIVQLAKSRGLGQASR